MQLGWQVHITLRMIKSDEPTTMKCEMMYPYIRSEAQNFRQDAVFQKDQAPPEAIHAVCPFREETFLNSRIEKSGSICWPARSPDPTRLTKLFLPSIWKGLSVSKTLFLT